jgi:hypothetical protein
VVAFVFPYTRTVLYRSAIDRHEEPLLAASVCEVDRPTYIMSFRRSSTSASSSQQQLVCYNYRTEVLDYDYTWDDAARGGPQPYPRTRERGEPYIDSYNDQPWSWSAGTNERVRTDIGLQLYTRVIGGAHGGELNESAR